MSFYVYITVFNPIDIGRMLINSLYARNDKLLKCSVKLMPKFVSEEEIAGGSYDLRSDIFSIKKPEIIWAYKKEIEDAMGVCLQTRNGLAKLLNTIEKENISVKV